MTDNQTNILFVFPGQGSQYAGMGSDLCREFATARTIYERAGEVLGYDIAALSANDPEGRLNLTRFTQPALLTHSVACLEVLRELTGGRVRASIAAGHSLGEYSALVAAGSLDFESALKLVARRGELMGEYGEGEMTAFPMDIDTIRPIAERYHCAVAGCNMPQQTVVGGNADDLEQVEKFVSEQFPRKRAVRLKTEGAFHTYYMVDAARHFRQDLAATDFAAPEVPVLSNFSGGLHDDDPQQLRSRLFFQLFNPVLWHANMVTALDSGVEAMVEFGGGIGQGETPEEKRPNLEGMIKKSLRGIERDVSYTAAINAQTLIAAAETLG